MQFILPNNTHALPNGNVPRETEVKPLKHRTDLSVNR